MSGRVLVFSGFVFLATVATGADTLPTPPYPVSAYRNHEEGFLIIELRFDSEGKVAACRIVRSNAPYDIESSTVAFIRKRWVGKSFAGKTQTFPVSFYLRASSGGHFIGDLVPPPDLLAPGDAARSLKLRVTFGGDSWVKDVQIIEPSGLDSLDRDTAIWVKVHWHHQAYANQVMDVPFQFAPPSRPPVSAPAAVSHP